MKKGIIIILNSLLCLCVLLTSCGYNRSGNNVPDEDGITMDEKRKIADEAGVGYSRSYLIKHKTIDEMANVIINDYQFYYFLEKVFEHPTQKEKPDVLTMYVFENVPEEYELEEIWTSGSFMHFVYKRKDGNNKDESLFSFAWCFGAEEYFEDYEPGSPVFEVNRLRPSEKYPGRWEGTDGISWGENGYHFSARIPYDLYGTFDLKLKEITFPRG